MQLYKFIYNDDELKDNHLANDGDVKKTNTKSMFTSYVDCAVTVVYQTMNYPA